FEWFLRDTCGVKILSESCSRPGWSSAGSFRSAWGRRGCIMQGKPALSGDRMSGEKFRDGGRRDAEVWLRPRGGGSERLARALGIGPPAGQDVGSELEELREDVRRLEQRVLELSGDARDADLEATPLPNLPTVELRNTGAPLANDRSFWLAHCDDFE